MPAEFISRGTGGSTGGRRFEIEEKDGGLFWWTIIIIILTGLVVFSWVFSIYVFSYPEKAFNYKLLVKLEKIDPLKSYPRLDVPGGKERAAKNIYASFYDYDETLTDVKNEVFKRSYLWNYTEEAPIYIYGKFTVNESRFLTAEDVFTSGVVVRAKSDEYPNAFLEFILPTKPENVPDEQFRPGDSIVLEKNRSYASVLHIERLGEDDLLISAVSLVYGRLRIDDTRFVNQDAPTMLNMEGNWPITGTTMFDADQDSNEDESPDSADAASGESAES